MGFLGGSSQSTSTALNTLDFSPVFNLGDGNSSAMDKTFDNNQTTSPRLDDSTGISASTGVGFGGSGSGGTAQTSRQQLEDKQPTQVKPANSSILPTSINPTYLLIGGGVIAVLLVLKKRFKK